MRKELSPHLTIYSTQISSGLSIFHRMTGVILAGAIMLVIPAMLAYTFFGNGIEIAFEIFYAILFVIMGAIMFLLSFTIFVDFRFYILLAACIAVHVNHGFDSIFLDYVHNAQAKNALSTLVKFALFASFVFIGVILL